MYDIIIIGAGTAGISAYKEAVKHTQNILIINQGPWDTTCARVGCMPSKVLISTANRMHDIEHADEVALSSTGTIDTSQVMPHVRKLRDQFTAATIKDVDRWNPEHKISASAKFINANTVEAAGQRYQAKTFIIAVGSTPNYDTDWKNILKDRLITSDDIFELTELPQSMAVIGSGVIAIELAQAMTRLGVKTTVFARSRKVGALTSPELQQVAQDVLSQELDIRFEVLPEHVRLENEKVILSFKQNNQDHTVEVDYVLSATGRRSLLSSLQLENIDPTFADIKNLKINDASKQLADYPIFIIGDAHTQNPIQHIAATDGRNVVQNCLNFPNIQTLDAPSPLSIVFSAPEMAIAGLSHKQLLQKNILFATGKVSFETQGRATVLGKNKGAAEVYVDMQSRKLLGAELFVESAEHMAHLLSWIIAEDLTIDEVLTKPFYHPTLEEGLRTALVRAFKQL